MSVFLYNVEPSLQVTGSVLYVRAGKDKISKFKALTGKLST